MHGHAAGSTCSECYRSTEERKEKPASIVNIEKKFHTCRISFAGMSRSSAQESVTAFLPGGLAAGGMTSWVLMMVQALGSEVATATAD